MLHIKAALAPPHSCILHNVHLFNPSPFAGTALIQKFFFNALLAKTMVLMQVMAPA